MAEFEVRKETIEAISNALDMLNEDYSDAEMAADDKSERWQDGERGEITRDWIIELSERVEELEQARDWIEENRKPDYGDA